MIRILILGVGLMVGTSCVELAYESYMVLPDGSIEPHLKAEAPLIRYTCEW